jgi:hypothetical protein
MSIRYYVFRDGKQRAERQAEGVGGRNGSPMLIGAVIAGLLIVSLFLEMVSSSPKAGQEEPNPAHTAK